VENFCRVLRDTAGAGMIVLTQHDRVWSQKEGDAPADLFDSIRSFCLNVRSPRFF